MVWLNQRFNQSSPEPYVSSFCLLDHSMLCNVLVGDLECVLVMPERSPLHLFLYLFILKKETKVETNKGSAGLNIGETKLFYYYYNNFFIIHPTFTFLT